MSVDLTTDVEQAKKSSSRHDAHFGFYSWGEITLPDGSEVLAVERGPAGKIAGKDHAGMAASIEKFRATFHPVFRVEANHQASLVV